MDNKKQTGKSFDFDEWVRLAQDDPEKFEQLRRERIEQMMAQVPESMRQRIEGLQWQIDQARDRSKNPLASCIKISSMMWDSVLGDAGLVQTIEDLGKSTTRKEPDSRPAATVLDFKSRADKPE